MNVATVHTDHGRYVGIPNGNGTVTLHRRGPSGTAPASRPDPISALAEEWGRELASVTPDGVRIADYGVRNLRAEEESWCRAESKRARRAAKRAEDERRTARGKWLSGNRAEEGIALAPDGEDVPSGFWDAVASGFTWDDYEAPLPQWKWRSCERRALPGMERPWFARYKGWRNLYTLIRRVGQGRFRALVLRGAL